MVDHRRVLSIEPSIFLSMAVLELGSLQDAYEMRNLVGILPAILPNLCQSLETPAIPGFPAMHGVPSGLLIR
jgi:hypothetical protein